MNMSSNTFLYFAYGSNLLAKRIHINNSTAVRDGIGKLIDYRLDFNTFSTTWKGASATIVPTKGSDVWGAIWKIDNKHLPDLDRQEGVHLNLYEALYVSVQHPDGNYSKCRVYKQTEVPSMYTSIEELPETRRPSGVYLKTILLGASESKLPPDYIDFLSKIPDNGYHGAVDVGLDLNEIRE